MELAEINITAPEAGRYYAAVFSSASASIGNNKFPGCQGQRPLRLGAWL